MRIVVRSPIEIEITGGSRADAFAPILASLVPKLLELFGDRPSVDEPATMVIPEVTIEPGQSAVVEVAPLSKVFRPHQIVVANASAFVIDELFIGGEPQISAPVPAVVLVNGEFEFDEVDVHVGVLFRVRNVDTGPRVFGGAIHGRVRK